MSRAIDKATAAALQTGDPEAAFQAIADVLTETTSTSTSTLTSASASASMTRSTSTSSTTTDQHYHDQERLEIEFLGREHPPLPDGEYILREGNAVAIPKLALVQAFLVARKKLQKYRTAILVNGDNKSILRTTAVILLMDPEHLTAANTRKRLIQTALLAVDASRSALLASELHLVDSLLTSHLHRHTKSPTLWSHRRWLISCLANPAADKTRLLHDMTHVVMVAAVRHPRNYYAWEHARWLVQWQSQGGKTCGSKEEEDERLKLVVVVRDWCYRNHTDTSGWSFLFFVLASLPTTVSAVNSAQLANMSPLYEETVTQVEQMATSLRWTGEAVWVFLRTAVAYHEHYRRETGTAITNIDTEQYTRFQEAASILLATVEPTSHEHQILTRAQERCTAKRAEQTTGTDNTT